MSLLHLPFASELLCSDLGFRNAGQVIRLKLLREPKCEKITRVACIVK